jgi:spore coat protein A
MPSRRQVVKGGVVAGAAAAVGGPYLLTGRAEAQVINPTTIPKYVTPLFIMPAMPRVRLGTRDEYSVANRQISQQILPPGFPRTAVFGWGSTTDSRTFHSPGFTIEARVNRPTQVTWRNQLMDSSGNFLPSLTTVDPTLHWANPPGGVAGRDSTPSFTSTPPPYRGPIPFVVHHHGSRDFQESDGYPEAWFLPPARNIPNGFARVGSLYDQFKEEARQRWGVFWQPGSAIFVYPNDQPAGTNWMHDHSLGMTRNNVYSGQVCYFLLRGGSRDLPAGVLPGPAPQIGDPPGTRYYEIPIVLQDKSFNNNGSLFFPASRTEAGDTQGPFIPQTDIPPYWNPVFLANTIVVNGNTWPFLEVEPRRYRFRFLAAAGIRPWVLKIVTDPLAPRPAPAALPMWLIGSDGGYLARPVQLAQLPINTAERYDVIVDFTGLTPGTRLFLSNEGGGSDPATTGQIMQFRVVPLTSRDTSTPPAQLTLPGFVVPGSPQRVRRLSTQFFTSSSQPGVITRLAVGTVNPDGTPNPLPWDAPLTENPAFNSTEDWEFHNFTQGGHSMHIHLVQFQVLNRQPIGGGPISPPMPHEVGPKDVVFAPGATTAGGPGMITRVRMHFDRRSLYVWHCHFLDHEDHEMMRPFRVV